MLSLVKYFVRKRIFIVNTKFPVVHLGSLNGSAVSRRDLKNYSKLPSTCVYIQVVLTFIWCVVFCEEFEKNIKVIDLGIINILNNP